MKAYISCGDYEREARGTSEEINTYASWASMGGDVKVEYPNGLVVRYYQCTPDCSIYKVVVNDCGDYLCWSAVEQLMDSEICENLNDSGLDAYIDCQQYFEANANMHYDKYGEEFAPWVGGEW